jgi:hypothetical protein|tara:strand:- start:271 stop:483 length:213 start_codon:yes stop_codon:yes gene_type:complete
MKKDTTIKSSAGSAPFVSKPLGQSKATKFSQVEGLTLNGNHVAMFKQLTARGLKGDILRSAITGSFQKKR